MARPADPNAKGALIAAARAEFVKKGIRAARIEDITAACGLSKGAFYLHFDSKEALFGELVDGFKVAMEEVSEERVRRMQKFLDTRGPVRAEDVATRSEKYEELLELDAEEDLRVLEVLWEFRDVTSVLISGSQATEFEGLIWEIVDREVQRCAAIFTKFQKTGSCRKDVNPALLGSMSVGTYLLVAKQMASDPQKPDLPFLAHTLQRLLREGCQLPSPKAAQGTEKTKKRNAKKRRRSSMGTFKRILALALLCLGLGGALSQSACKARAAPSQAPNEPTPPSVTRVPVERVRWAGREEVTGSLFPARALHLGFEVSGRLEAILVQKGQKVKSGQVLAHLNSDIALAQLAQSRAQVAAAQAAFEMASDVARRNARLKAQGSVSEVQNKNATSSSKQAAAQLLAAKANLAQAEAMAKRHDLRAPFDGTVIDVPDQPGATVSPGDALFTLEQLDALVLKTTVAEKTRSALKTGARVKVSSVGGVADTDQAVIRDILPSADSVTRRIPVEIAVPNLDGRFVAHTLARAELPLGDPQEAQALPASALASEGGDHVFVLSPTGALKVIPVFVLSRSDQRVIVKTPTPLDQVVDNPTADFSEGVKVSAR